MIAAAKLAHCHEFIMARKGRYDAVVGEKGMKLSGGERQRIAIARAFLRGSPILLLDEPTSSIDSRTEAVILDALDRLMVGRTTFMIAHRLSSLRRPDRILVLDSGRIVEQGCTQELLARDGLFARLWNAQKVGAAHANGNGNGAQPVVVPSLAITTVDQVAM
jgi:ABC-type multidrug transport system fused ATPase/permease subunit